MPGACANHYIPDISSLTRVTNSVVFTSIRVECPSEWWTLGIATDLLQTVLTTLYCSR